MEEMRRISKIDHKAICINGYYMGFGLELSQKKTQERIMWMYKERLNQLKGDFLGGITAE